MYTFKLKINATIFNFDFYKSKFKKRYKIQTWVFLDFIHGKILFNKRLTKRYPLIKHMVGKQSLP